MPKRKAVDAEAAASKKAKLTNTNTEAKPTKKGSATRKGRSKKIVQADEEPPKPRVKRINKALKAKVKQVADFVDTTGRETSRLKRSDANENHVVVSEACLLGSLMAMHADWELTDPRMASLLEAGEAIVEQYEEKWATSDAMVRMVVLDLDKETAFVEGIQQKVEGWGLEGINLLEVELELYQKKAEDEATLRLFSAFDSDDQADEGSVKIVDDIESTENNVETSLTSEESSQESQGIAANIALDKESGREGVCPAPIKLL